MSKSQRIRLRLDPAEQRETQFLTVSEAAAFLRVSSVSLGKWRIAGTGPRYCKFGRRVLYDRADLLAWAADQKRRSTSQQPAVRA